MCTLSPRVSAKQEKGIIICRHRLRLQHIQIKKVITVNALEGSDTKEWWVRKPAETVKPFLGLEGLSFDSRGDALNFNLFEEHKGKKDLQHK